MAARALAPSAFDSTDPHIMATLTGMPAITRAVLTCLHIDPSLSRQVERDRLRAVVNIAAGKASNDVVGNAYRALRQLWSRGFPLPAFDDPSSPPLSVDEARVHLGRTRAELKTRMHKPDREEEVIYRMLVLLLGEVPAPAHVRGRAP